MTLSFGLDATSALEALQTPMKRFGDDDLNEDLARDCTIKAWHRCDHVWQALGPKSPVASLRKILDHAKRSYAELAYLQDICNGSKHATVTMYTPRINEARHHRDDLCRDAFSSEEFETSRLEIDLFNGRTISIHNGVSRVGGLLV